MGLHDETEDAAGRDQLDLMRGAAPQPVGRDWAADLALCGAAPPGPWGVRLLVGGSVSVDDAAGGPVAKVVTARGDWLAVAEFVAASRDALPAAIREVLRLRAMVDSLAARVAGQAELLARRAMKEDIRDA